MLGDFERRPASAHRFPQCPSYIRRSQHYVAACLRVTGYLFNETQWLIYVFYYLDSNDTIEFAVRRNLLDSSNEYLGTCCTRDLCAVGRKLCADAPIEQRSRFVKQVAIAAADLQKIATSQPALGEISQ
jgi:hypothetical protein